MARRIILFLSDYKEDAREKSYRCPVGEDVAGVQTNEAPVRYLLRQYSGVEEIICIVTPRAKAAAWAPFRDRIAGEYPDIVLTEIPYEEGEDFAGAPLAGIMGRVRAGDEVLLETTGGFRNAVMDLLLLSRVLSYTGVRTVGAVYSSLQKAEVEDLSRLIGSFELVAGMQELTSFGSVRTLRTYYGQTEDARIRGLLTAMEDLYEAISLCRTKQIDGCMRAFNGTLTAAESCSDPMMRQLLPAFRAKFGRELTTLSLIEWCVSSEMLQQAVTIYTERIPAYIVQCGYLLQVTEHAWTPRVQEYEDAAAAQFMRGFFTLSKKYRPRGMTEPPRAFNDNSPMVYVDTIRYLEGMHQLGQGSRYGNFFGYKLLCSVSQMQQVCRDYLYVKTVRNMMNHANDTATQDQKELSEYLAGHGYVPLESVSADGLRQAILRGVQHLKPREGKEQIH